MRANPRIKSWVPLLALLAATIAGCFVDSMGTSGSSAADGSDPGTDPTTMATASSITTSTSTSSPSSETSSSGEVSTCASDCGEPSTCGDGVPQTDEQCDDGNDIDDDACSNLCRLRCGDGLLQADEQCDDSNLDDADGCVHCQMAHCGDGFVRAGVEACDDGEATAGCDADCTLAICGDSVINSKAGETCDLGAQNGAYQSACNESCDGPGPTCGDMERNGPEACDGPDTPKNTICQPDCTAECVPGSQECDDDLTDGCENLSTDENHCSECGMKCPLLWDCVAGLCTQ